MASATGLPQLSEIPQILSTWADNFTSNTTGAFARMTTKDWIRMIMVVGTYLLLRPHLVKFGARFQQKQFEKQQKQEVEEARAKKGGLNANDLRGARKIEIPGLDSSDEESGNEEAGGEGSVEWGRRARVRQRKYIRKVVSEHEQKLHEKATESDKEIEDLLED